ncbi:MAG: hypothetical protein R2875_15935 [Desulfobacterales bacterium]
MVLAAIAGALIAVAVWALLKFSLLQQVLSVINESTAGLFVLLMAFLPLAGVPISLFCFFWG